MREIKFRAWDKRDAIMRTLFLVNSKGVLLEVGFVEPQIREPEEIILMRYIGLKAQDKRDLYEGDIVVFTNREADHTPTAIIWNDYDLQFQTLGHGSLTDSEFTFQKAGQDCVAQNIKVIGNIYETPELLKVAV